MSTYMVHALDVWGNDEDGYQVNDVYPSQGTLEIADNLPAAKVIDALADAQYIDVIVDMDLVRVDDQESAIYIDYMGKPVFELRKVQITTVTTTCEHTDRSDDAEPWCNTCGKRI